MECPSITVVIPTYNSEKTLEMCLESIVNQDYPKDKIEIIIADGGSVDRTLEIARRYTDKIFNNPLKTGEAGKAVGVKKANGDIIALIDSDNILPTKDWFKKMIKPFIEDEEIVGSEPLYYTYRKEDGYITRYCALIGMNDPLCLYMGNYDRYCLITDKWTELNIKEEDRGDYLKIEINEREIPTIGANGFMIRRKMLKKCSIDDYLFDIDVVYELVKQGYNKFAKVKVGIIHIFSGSISTFIRKQRRRIKDYSYYKKLGLRKYPWSSLSRGKLLKFIVYTVFILPLLFQVIKGYRKKPDVAWFFHIPACWITLLVYGFGTLQNYLFGVKPEDRSKWKQG
ncbi:glycosyltransferase family 2 protein [Methanocaldococcus indicus]|uniref:glycosyltransferase family 2 protein n=1 Tax=Methanocaldococcus indicus TaxID=213231 RepID=UPI003C6D9976